MAGWRYWLTRRWKALLSAAMLWPQASLAAHSSSRCVLLISCSSSNSSLLWRLLSGAAPSFIHRAGDPARTLFM